MRLEPDTASRAWANSIREDKDQMREDKTAAIHCKKYGSIGKTDKNPIVDDRQTGFNLWVKIELIH